MGIKFSKHSRKGKKSKDPSGGEEESMVAKRVGECSSAPPSSAKKQHKGKLYGLKRRLTLNKSGDQAANGGSSQKKVVYDETTNRELWQNIVEKNLVGCRLSERAAIFNLKTGHLCAHTPQQFRLTVGECMHITEGLYDPTVVSKSGMHICGIQFDYVSSQIGNTMIARAQAKKSTPTQMAFIKSGQNHVLVSCCDGEDIARSVIENINELFDSLKSGMQF